MSLCSGLDLHGDTHAAYVPTRRPLRIGLGFGQSNLRGADSTGGPFNGVALSTAHPWGSPVFWEYDGVSAAAAVTTYRTPASPVPWLFEKMQTYTSSPRFISWAIASTNEVTIRNTQLPGAYATLRTLGIAHTDVDFVWFVHGESELQTVTDANDYKNTALERIVRIIEADYPNAVIAINMVASENQEYAIVRQAQAAVAAARSNRVLVDLADFKSTGRIVGGNVHYTDGAAGTFAGQEEAVRRMWNALHTIPA